MIKKINSLSDRVTYLCISLFCVILYGNTIFHEYTQDDAIVIYDNMYTQQGIKGIPGLLTKDTFFGFFKTEGKAKLVSGGRYRPLTPILFALELQLFGKKPMIGHIMNVFWYCLLCIFLFKVLYLILDQIPEIRYPKALAFAACILFASHPVHTEVVANIKGRDEIVALFGSVFSLYLVLKQPQKRFSLRSFLIAFVFFLACMSKENAITFLGIIPLTLVLFWRKSIKESIILTLPAFSGFIGFIICRTLVLGLDFGGAPIELMNNPFIKYMDGTYVPFTGEEKISTIAVTLLKYLQLLIFPIQLTHDYYPRHIDIYTLKELKPILGIVINLSLILMGMVILKKEKILGFGILFYYITGSVVSNIFFPVGTNMSERFLFMPSVGFSLVAAYLLYKILPQKKGLYPSIILIICLLFSWKTIHRNKVWVNDYTLFTTDVHNSPNSAKVLNAAGGASIAEATKMEDGDQKQSLLNNAITYLKRAVGIHPKYKNAYLLLGNAYYYTGQLDLAITSYEKALNIDPDYKEAAKNLGVTLRDAGRKAGEIDKDIAKSINYLDKSIFFNPTDGETYRLLGVANGIAGNHQKAIENFKKVVDLNPNNAAALLNLSRAYTHIKDLDNANKYRSQALSLDPNILKK